MQRQDPTARRTTLTRPHSLPETVRVLKRPQQYGELVNLSPEPSDHQQNLQRSFVLAMVEGRDVRMVSSQVSEFTDVGDINVEMNCLAWVGSIKSTVFEVCATRQTSSEHCRAWQR